MVLYSASSLAVVLLLVLVYGLQHFYPTFKYFLYIEFTSDWFAPRVIAAGLIGCLLIVPRRVSIIAYIVFMAIIPAIGLTWAYLAHTVVRIDFDLVFRNMDLFVMYYAYSALWVTLILVILRITHPVWRNSYL